MNRRRFIGISAGAVTLSSLSKSIGSTSAIDVSFSISEVCSNRSNWEEDTDCTVWEKSDIESRTEHIAEFAEERWKPDYS